MKNLNRLSMHLAAAAVAATAATSASAAIVHRPGVNISIPVTTSGVYLNVATGVFATTPAGATGWDVNPWSSTGLSIWANNAAGPNDGVVLGGGATGTNVGNLAFGTTIGPSNTYGRTPSALTTGSLPFALNSSNNLVGFRFLNEGTGQVHYGWMRLSLGATLTTASRSIVEYAFDDVAGRPIEAGAIPAPGAAGLLALGGLVAARRRRA
jgi:MYXO-CTERM domain-containing protein